MSFTLKLVATAAGIVLVIIIAFWLVNPWQSGEDNQGSPTEVASARDSGPATATPVPTPPDTPGQTHRSAPTTAMATATPTPTLAQPTAVVVPTKAAATTTPAPPTPPAPVASPSATPAPPEPSPTVQPTPRPTLDWPTLATAVASREPRHLTQEAAQQEVPFPILMPTYLPDGFEPRSPREFVRMLEGTAYGNEVKGLAMTFRGQPPPDGGFPPTFQLEQELGSMPDVMVVDEAVKSEADVNGYPAIYLGDSEPGWAGP